MHGRRFYVLFISGIAFGCSSKAAPAVEHPADGAGGSGTNGGPTDGGQVDGDPNGGCIPTNGWAPAVPRTSDGKLIDFYPALVNPWVGDWQGQGGYVAQVFAAAGGGYQANLLRAFDVPNDAPVAVLQGTASCDSIAWSGGGWTGTIAHGRFTAQNGAEAFDLELAPPTSTTLGALPPAGAIVLFDGKNLDAWAKKNATNWLLPDGPPQWKLVEGDAMEVVPGTDSLITKQVFGDYRLHVEFRTLGTPTNSGVFLAVRYESNINEGYGHFDGNAAAGFDNCTPAAAKLAVRASRPPLAWQTLDIAFRAPRFDANDVKTESARASVELNGVRIYDQMQLDPPTGAGARLGEASTGPVMLQEHGMELQFRNIWLVEPAP